MPARHSPFGTLLCSLQHPRRKQHLSEVVLAIGVLGVELLGEQEEVLALLRTNAEVDLRIVEPRPSEIGQNRYVINLFTVSASENRVGLSPLLGRDE